ncbi:MAG: decaprenyl-phosphate phosphoribosyltransferase [Planctomycetota bacterium]
MTATWALIIALRPWQWLKNLVVFAALIFAQRANDPEAVLLSVLAFASFCLASSAGYLVNDLKDIDLDRRHPTKRRRPIASGRLSVPAAGGAALLLFLGAAAIAWFVSDHELPLGSRFIWIPLLYVGLSLTYSMILKRYFLVDVLTIAMGFLLRVVGGGVAISVEVSSWLLVSTFFMAVFLGLGKRRGELRSVAQGDSNTTRPVLTHYDESLLDILMSSTAAALLVSYVLYTVSPHTVAQFGSRALFYTVPFAFYGIGRYLAVTLRSGEADDVAVIFWRDRPMQIACGTWGLVVLLIIYW